MDPDRVWGDAMSIVQGDLDGETVEEAHEVYLAEAGRTRLRDRRGPARILLRSGREVMGVFVADQRIAEWILLDEHGEALLVINERAIAVVIGSTVSLRPEPPMPSVPAVAGERSLGSWLRDVWLQGDVVRAHLAVGEQVIGTVTFVGSDHADLQTSSGPVTLPFEAVDLWSVAGPVG